MCRVFTLNLVSQEVDQGCLRKILLITGKQEAGTVRVLPFEHPTLMDGDALRNENA